MSEIKYLDKIGLQHLVEEIDKKHFARIVTYKPGFGTIITPNNNIVAEVKYEQRDTEWKSFSWTNAGWLSGSHIWVDYNGVIHYDWDFQSDHKYLAEDGVTWVTKTWKGFSGINGSRVWMDYNNNIHYDYSNVHYILGSDNETWEAYTYIGLTVIDRGLWTDYDGIVHYDNGSSHYKLLSDCKTWEEVKWPDVVITAGEKVWKDASGVLHYDAPNTHAILSDTGVWRKYTWIGDIAIPNGDHVWKSTNGIYHYDDGSTHYVLDENMTWSTFSWPGNVDITANYIWNDPNGITHYDYKDNSNNYHFYLEKEEHKYITNHGDELQTKLTAGSNITIENGVISSTGGGSTDNFYTKAEVDEKISTIPKFDIKVVSALPTSDISTTTIYLLVSTSSKTGNLYTEYIYVNSKWEQLGEQTVDLSGYATEAWVESKGYLTSVPSHNQASSTITAMTGYTKPTSTSAIAATDNLNTAIGKLEKALDNKGTSNLIIGTTATTAAAGNHKHDGVYEPKHLRWGGINGASNTGNKYILIGEYTHSPAQYKEWAITLRIRGAHNTLHSDTVIRIWATDSGTTEIQQNPGISHICLPHGNMPHIRLYKVSNTKTQIGLYKNNDWTNCICELLDATGTTFTALDTQLAKGLNDAYAKDYDCGLQTTISNRLAINELRSGYASVVHYQYQGTSLGYIGFVEADKPAVWMSDSNTRKHISLEGHTHSEYLPAQRMVNGEQHTSAVGITPFNVQALKAAGKPLFGDPEFNSGVNGIVAYNNANNGVVTITRDLYSNISGLQSPANSGGYVLKIATAATGTTSPGIGGFNQQYKPVKNQTIVHIFRALIPNGALLSAASNPIGTAYTMDWITQRTGTGKWEWYAYVIKAGTDCPGTNTTGFIFVEPTGATRPFTWYLSYANMIDISNANYDGLRTVYSDYATSAGTATNAVFHQNSLSTMPDEKTYIQMSNQNSNSTGLPGTGWYHIINSVWGGKDTSWPSQFAFPTSDSQYKHCYYRYSNNTATYGSGWIRLANASELNSYLPLTGGTLTGDLTLNSSGTVSSGNTKAVTGGTVYNYCKDAVKYINVNGESVVTGQPGDKRVDLNIVPYTVYSCSRTGSVGELECIASTQANRLESTTPGVQTFYVRNNKSASLCGTLTVIWNGSQLSMSSDNPALALYIVVENYDSTGYLYGLVYEAGVKWEVQTLDKSALFKYSGNFTESVDNVTPVYLTSKGELYSRVRITYTPGGYPIASVIENNGIQGTAYNARRPYFSLPTGLNEAWAKNFFLVHTYQVVFTYNNLKKRIPIEVTGIELTQSSSIWQISISIDWQSNEARITNTSDTITEYLIKAI